MASPNGASRLIVDYRNAMSEAIGAEHGLTKARLDAIAPKVAAEHARISAEYAAGDQKWFDLPDNTARQSITGSDALGGWVPIRSDDCETTVLGLYVVGAAAGAGSTADLMAEAEHCGAQAARTFGFTSTDLPEFPSTRLAATHAISTAWKQHFVEASTALPRSPIK